jgi:hypothetical protein
MHVITEIFTAPSTKAEKLFWLPQYIRLAKSVYDGYTRDGETSERHRYTGNCASRWGISRRCATAILTGEGSFEITDKGIIITRPVLEA